MGAANAWSILSADPARDLVFVPTSSPSPDYFGGERLGSNRYANSVVALRASTGRVVWSFQVVHHDLWDYDVPAQPVLTNVLREGREIPVVVQATKMGHLFVLHRETGAPIFPVEERPVPASDVPGEQASPTQPFPTAPPALVPHTLAPEDAWGLTPWDRGRCRERIARLRNEGIFTPPSLRGTLAIPGNAGGSNWGSVAIDPTRRWVLLNLTNLAFEVRLIPRADFEREKAAGRGLLGLREFAPQAGTPYGLIREPLLSPLQLPCNPPPWGSFAAVSLDDGRLLWQVPLGGLPDRLRIPLPVTIGPAEPRGSHRDRRRARLRLGRDGRRAARLRHRDRRRAVERPSPGRRQRHAHDLPGAERPPVRADRRGRPRQAGHAARRLGGGLCAAGGPGRPRSPVIAAGGRQPRVAAALRHGLASPWGAGPRRCDASRRRSRRGITCRGPTRAVARAAGAAGRCRGGADRGPRGRRRVLRCATPGSASCCTPPRCSARSSLSGAAAARAQAPVAGAAALYHAFHFLAWVALGFAGSALMAHAERTRTRWLPPLAALLALVPLAVLDVFVRNAQLERTHLWLGGLVGILAMGGFLAWRHPGAVRSEAAEARERSEAGPGGRA